MHIRTVILPGNFSFGLINFVNLSTTFFLQRFLMFFIYFIKNAFLMFFFILGGQRFFYIYAQNQLNIPRTYELHADIPAVLNLFRPTANFVSVRGPIRSSRAEAEQIFNLPRKIPEQSFISQLHKKCLFLVNKQICFFSD